MGRRISIWFQRESWATVTLNSRAISHRLSPDLTVYQISSPCPFPGGALATFGGFCGVGPFSQTTIFWPGRMREELRFRFHFLRVETLTPYQ